jgi:hypothetical protein
LCVARVVAVVVAVAVAVAVANVNDNSAMIDGNVVNLIFASFPSYCCCYIM